MTDDRKMTIFVRQDQVLPNGVKMVIDVHGVMITVNQYQSYCFLLVHSLCRGRERKKKAWKEQA